MTSGIPQRYCVSQHRQPEQPQSHSQNAKSKFISLPHYSEEPGAAPEWRHPHRGRGPVRLSPSQHTAELVSAPFYRGSMHRVYPHAVIPLCFLLTLSFGLSPKTGRSSMSVRVPPSLCKHLCCL